MFSSIVNNIRDKFKNNPPPHHHQQTPAVPEIRKSSVDSSIHNEDDDHDQYLSLHKTVSSPSASLHRPRSSMDEAANNSMAAAGRKLSVTEAIPVQQQRRRSTLFGISNVSADDYIQKDLISSSWS